MTTPTPKPATPSQSERLWKECNRLDREAIRLQGEVDDLRAERDRLRSRLLEQHFELRSLRAFAQDCFAEWPEIEELCEEKVLVIAEEHGLMEKVEVAEPCGETCQCAEYGPFPLTCYRRTDLLTGKEDW